MAKITTGPLVSEIRNALGAQVFSRNQYGAYTRARTAPDNSPTPARLITRARITAASTLWSHTLTDPQRLAWMAYALNFQSRPGPVNGKPPTGRSAYISAYANLDNIGVTPLVTPPNQPLAGAVADLQLSIDCDSATFELDGNVPAGAPTQGLVVFATPPLNQGRYFGWHFARQISAHAPGWTFPLDLWDQYNEIFDTPAAPNVVILWAEPIAEVSGLAGPKQCVRALAQGEGAPMIIKTTVLTDAQIKALPTTPVTIVAAVVGKIIVPFLTVLQLDATAGAYANISAGAGQMFRTVCVTDKSVRILNTELLSGAAKECVFLASKFQLDAIPPTVPRLYVSPDDPAALTNQPLLLNSDNALGDFTGGNAANTLTCTTYYQLIDPV